MTTSTKSLPTIGLEEEMFLVDGETYDCVAEMPERFEREARRTLGHHFEREMISSMVELVSSCHSGIASLCEEMQELRHKLGRVAARHGFRLMACGTHPFSKWPDQTVTGDSRYQSIAQTVKLPSIRGHACGLHVHVGLPGADRISLMRRLRPFLPLFLALSTSSPFWQGRVTGLKSYRTAVNSEMPRSGLPPVFASEEDYAAAVTALIDAGMVPDESFLWWAMRPSLNHPTVELRICDSCTRLSDALVVAALYRTLFYFAARSEDEPSLLSGAAEVILDENRWQAARHGIDAHFIVPDCSGAADIGVILRKLSIAMQVASCELESEDCFTSAARIVSHGTSADRQLAVFESAACEPGTGALRAVARSVADETIEFALCDAH